MTFSAALHQALAGQAAAGVPNGLGMGMGMMEDDEEDDDDEDDEEGGQQFHLPGSTCAPPVSPATGSAGILHRLMLRDCSACTPSPSSHQAEAIPWTVQMMKTT